MDKNQIIQSFDPNSPASAEGGIFGLPFERKHASIVLLPVPWDVTVSFSDGASLGPKTILKASGQVDLYDPLVKDAWKSGIFMEQIPASIQKLSRTNRKKAVSYIGKLEKGADENSAAMKKAAKEIDAACEKMNDWVYQSARKVIAENKIPALIGGDHSTPLGMIKAVAEKTGGVGILQLDAHCDLRKAYEGFTYSHASIMYNALKFNTVSKLVQVGIRDWCEEEEIYIRKSNGRVITFYDHELKRDVYEGSNWKMICKKVIDTLPQNVYISFDIDALDPKLCPSTGTPVPGGLEFNQAWYLFAELVRSGKRIVGFDLNEVAPSSSKIDADDWNGNVGARMLYRMCNLTAVSNHHAQWQ